MLSHVRSQTEKGRGGGDGDSVLKCMSVVEPVPLNVVTNIVQRSVCIEPFDHS